jgi:hypothetical protein
VRHTGRQGGAHGSERIPVPRPPQAAPIELVQDGAAWRLRGQITAGGTSAPAELTITDAAASGDLLQIRATTRVDRYAHGLTKARGLAGRHLDMEITARATRT